MLYKAYPNLIVVPAVAYSTQVIRMSKHAYRLVHHGLTYVTDYDQFVFFSRAICDWNNHRGQAAEASLLESFRFHPVWDNPWP